MANLLAGCVVLLISVVSAQGACNWPAVFAASTWLDSHRGEITFTATTMSGWDFTVDTYTVNNWECHTDQLDSTGYVVALATETFTKLSQTYYAYLCMKMTKLTDVSYRYYETYQNQANSNNERIYNNPSNTVSDLTIICNEANGASGGEFRVILKQGSESAAKQYCPSPLLARFYYTHTDTAGTDTCGTTTENWDVCTDRQQMTFDYNTCNTKVAYTASGTSWCVASVQVGSTWFVSTYNNDDATVDDSTTYRFACFAVNSDGTKASVAPKSCRYNQDVDSFPVETTVSGVIPTSTDIGATLTMSSFYTCPFTTTTTTTSATNSATTADNSVAVGLGVGLGLVLPILIAVGVLAFLVLTKKLSLDRCRKSKPEYTPRSPSQSAAPSEGRARRGPVSPNGIQTTTSSVVTMVDTGPDEGGLELSKTNLSPENFRPGSSHQTAPTSPRYDSPLPQQILTPREPSANPLSLPEIQRDNKL